MVASRRMGGRSHIVGRHKSEIRFSCATIFTFFATFSGIILTVEGDAFYNTFNGTHSNVTELNEHFRGRLRRAALSESSIHPINNMLAENIRLLVGVASIFCLSTVAVVMCIFCNACDDDKSSDVGGANGYVGQINLADIQVIYNPSAGAPQLPYVLHNEGFKSSQEDIVLANPAILPVTSCEGVTIRPSGAKQNPQHNQNLRGVTNENTASKQSRRLKDIYVEKGNTIKLEYENPYTDYQGDSVHRQADKIHSSREIRKETLAPSYKNSSVSYTNKSLQYYGEPKDYDMNDVAIKNMHARY